MVLENMQANGGNFSKPRIKYGEQLKPASTSQADIAPVPSNRPYLGGDNMAGTNHKLAYSNANNTLSSSSSLTEVTPVKDGMNDIEEELSESLLCHSHPYVDQPRESLKGSSSRSSVSSFSSSSLSDDEVETEGCMLTDPHYSKQIERALKLGYSEAHVEKALSNLGAGCGFDDLLSQLNQVRAGDAGKSALPFPPNTGGDLSVMMKSTKECAGPFFTEDSSDYDAPSLDSNNEASNLLTADTERSLDKREPNSEENNLRPIIIDGSNVAMSHGKTVFSCKGIQIAVNWFRERGHKEITAFVPQWRKETSRPDTPITDQDILADLEKEKIVVFTPARRVKGRRVVCYDDRYILNLADETDGIVVSNDVYRDLYKENERYAKVVDHRLLMYTFANDRFMPPEDPYGRTGLSLDNLLRKTPVMPLPRPSDCPYGKKCTYGNKCRFYHPERGLTPQRSITDILREQADVKLQERAQKISLEKEKRPKQKLVRTRSLVPGEVPGEIPRSPTALSDIHKKREKPKLGHSKSLVFPSRKSSDYLNEHRRKLEDAELAAALDNISLNKTKDNSLDSEIMKETTICDSDDTVFVECLDPCIPSASDNVNQQCVTLSRSSTPNTVSMPRSSASPVLLMVPKSEAQERYLSGHLLLAKKLSDEGNETHFFSDHASSPSNTRTSSPSGPGAETSDQKVMSTSESFLNPGKCGIDSSQFPHNDSRSGNKSQHESVSNYHMEGNIPFLSIFQSQASTSDHQLPPSYANADREMPNLSIFETSYSSGGGTSQMSCGNSENPSLTSRPRVHKSVGSNPSGISTTAHTLPLSNDGMYQGMIGNTDFQKQGHAVSGGEQRLPSDFISRTEQLHQPTLEHRNVQRANSSTGSTQRHGDSHISTLLGHNSELPPPHIPLRSQHSVPGQLYHTPQSLLSYPVSNLTRQNSTSDPQILSTAGLGEYQKPNVSSNVGMTHLKRDQYSDPNFTHNSSIQNDIRHIPLQRQGQNLHYAMPQQQQQQLYLSQQLPQQHLFPQQNHLPQQQHQPQQHYLPQQHMNFEALFGRPGIENRSLMNQPDPKTAAYVAARKHSYPFQYRPEPGQAYPEPCNPQRGHPGLNTQSFQPTTHLMPVSHFQYSAPVPFMSHHPVISSHYPGHLSYHQSPGSFQSYLPSVSRNPGSGPTGSSDSGFHSSPTYQPYAPSPGPTLPCLPEDSLIAPEDRRYSMYCRLKSLFLEPLVRKVMNRHPDLLDPDKLCQLIIACKQNGET